MKVIKRAGKSPSSAVAKRVFNILYVEYSIKENIHKQEHIGFGSSLTYAMRLDKELKLNFYYIEVPLTI
jgi:hypothetical protein